MFSLALAFLLVLFWTMVDEISRRRIQANLKNLLTGKDIKSLGDADLDASFKNLSGKLALLTEAIQKADNQVLVKEEQVIEKERKRIARDLHDTVSQEIFVPYDVIRTQSTSFQIRQREDADTTPECDSYFGDSPKRFTYSTFTFTTNRTGTKESG